MKSTAENSPIKIAMLTTSFSPSPMGGAEIQALRLARELKAKGMQTIFITSAQKGQRLRDVVEEIPVIRIRLFLSPFYHAIKKEQSDKPVRVDFGTRDASNFVVRDRKTLVSIFNYLVFFGNAYFHLRRRKPDIIYVPMVEWLAVVGVLLGKMLGTKVLIKDSTMNGLQNLTRYPFGARLQNLVVRNGYFVAMTRVIRESFRKAGVAESRIHVIPNGIDLQPPVLRTVKHSKFLFVGNLTQQPAKGVDILLKAWKEVIVHVPQAQLVVIGDGNIDSFQRFTQALGIAGQVHFTGKVSHQDIQNHLSESAAFILPSRREGMSNALLEAMAMGLPCIATDISGNQDLIESGVNGLLVPVEDELLLAGAIVTTFNNPEQAAAMGAAARKTIEAHYTLQHVSSQYSELFRALLRK